MDIPDWTYRIPWVASRGELVLKVRHILTEPVCPSVSLEWETSGEVLCRFSGDTIDEGVEAAIGWAVENLEFKEPATPCGRQQQQTERKA